MKNKFTGIKRKRGPTTFTYMGCPKCGGSLIKSYIMNRNKKGGVRALPTDFHFCKKCNQMLKLRLVVIK